jgi:hypothetical protein
VVTAVSNDWWLQQFQITGGYSSFKLLVVRAISNKGWLQQFQITGGYSSVK